MNILTIIKGLAIGIFTGALTMFVSAMIYFGIQGGSVPRIVATYGAVAGTLAFIIYLFGARKSARQTTQVAQATSAPEFRTTTDANEAEPLLLPASPSSARNSNTKENQ